MSASTSAKPQISAKPDWFAFDVEQPHLIATLCTQSGTYHFPPEYTMSRAPGFADSELTEVALSRTGTLWSYTNAGYAPPDPYVQTSDPFEPFAIAAVELSVEKMIVLGQVVDGVSSDELSVGMQMQLVSEPLFEDDQAIHMIWRWKPVEGTAVANDATSGGAA